MSESAKISLNTLWAPCLYTASHMLSLSILVEDQKAKIQLTLVYVKDWIKFRNSTYHQTYFNMFYANCEIQHLKLTSYVLLFFCFEGYWWLANNWFIFLFLDSLCLSQQYLIQPILPASFKTRLCVASFICSKTDDGQFLNTHFLFVVFI